MTDTRFNVYDDLISSLARANGKIVSHLSTMHDIKWLLAEEGCSCHSHPEHDVGCDRCFACRIAAVLDRVKP